MKSATIWLFACSLVAVIATNSGPDIFRKALEEQNEDDSGDESESDVKSPQSESTHPATREQLFRGQMTPVIRDVVSVGRLDYTAKDDDKVFHLTFFNASLEGLSHYKLQNFTKNISSKNLVDHQFQVNYANITFKGILHAMRFVLGKPDRTVYNYQGPSNVTLKNLTVNGILRVVDDNGQVRKPEIHINSSTMSTENFQLANTGWEYNGDLVTFIKNQLDWNRTNSVKQFVIDRVKENIIDYSSSAAGSAAIG